MAHVGHVEAFHDIEGFQVLHRLAGERRGENSMSPVVDRNGIEPDGLEFGQILFAEQAAGFGHESGDDVGQVAGVEHLGPGGGDGPQGLGQVLLDQYLSRLRGAAVDQIGGGGGRVLAEIRHIRIDEFRVLDGDGESLLGVLDGWAKDGRRVHGAVATEGLEPAATGAGNQRREGAAILLGIVVVERELGCVRGKTDVVEDLVLPVGGAVDVHVPQSADAGHIGLHHIESGGRGNGGVDGVAAVHQYAHARERGQRMGTGDHAPPSGGRRAMRGAFSRECH